MADNGGALGSTATDAEAEAMALKAQGNEFYKKKDTARALDLYTQAVALAPHVCTLHGNVSAVHMQRGDYKLAIEHGEAALSLGGEPAWRAKIYERIGRAWSALHHQQKAMQSYLSAMQAAPNNQALRKRVIAMMTLVQRMEHEMQQAEAKLARGKSDEGKFFGDEAVRLATELDDVEFRARAYHVRGQCLLETGKWDDAQEDFDAQRDYAQRAASPLVEAWAHTNLGKLATVRTQYTEAVACNQRAVDAFQRAVDNTPTADTGDSSGSGSGAVSDAARQAQAMLGRAHINLAVSKQAAGDVAGARAAASHGRELAERAGDTDGVALAESALALAAE